MEKIRKATKEDILRILELFNSDPNLIGNDSLEYKEEDILEFIERPTNRTFLYEEDDKIVGLISADFRQTSKEVVLEDIVIDKDYKRKGIGFKLQTYIESLAREEGMELLWLMSEEKNEATHKMLKKGGFKKGKRFYFFSKELE